MARRIPLKTLTAGVVTGGLIAGCSGDAGKGRVLEQDHPNILFLLADDQRADALSCAGNPYIQTPNIDRLAASGVRFSNAYVMGGHHGAISAPSRAMLLTGNSLFHVYDKLAGETTMPMYFAQNGYTTFGTGKWHNEKSAFEASFQQGRNVYLGGMANHYSIPLRDLDSSGQLTAPVEKGFSTDCFADAAIGFLNEYAEGERKQPFFCYVAFTVPHDPYSPRADFIDRYPAGSVPLPGNFIPLHPFQFDHLTVRDENLTGWPRKPEVIQQILADYYGLVSHLDQRIGDIVKTLKKQGLYRNTLIVYAADNGLAIGSHGLLGKQNLYEHSMKVPLIIAGPGIPKGKVRDALVYLFDLFPTLSAECSLPAPENIDGTSLSEVINGTSPGPRNSLFTAYRHTVRAVRTSQWKLIRYPERDYTQLFDLVKDPLELDNLAADPTFRPRVDSLMNLLRQWQITVQDTAPLKAKVLLPMEYDPSTLVRKPDQWQPEYTLKKYFSN
jgi:arylsulfatase A-like enzyme